MSDTNAATTTGTGVPELEWHVGEVLFDMDGTLIDSIAAVEDAWRTWAVAEEIDVPPGPTFHGRTAVDLVSSFLPPERVPEALERLGILEQNPRVPVLALPGAVELIAAIPAGRWAVVTSATRAVALARLVAGGIPLPELLVTGDDVGRGKPDPEPYRSGRRWATDDAPAVAFEDTGAGLRSARAAGCLAVGVVGVATAEELSAHADAVVASLTDVHVAGWDNHGITLRLRAIK
ncbi:HAD-IA family hydrolase [Streptomyces sp. ISL-90]|nr:HAD-IA family hydrolase [Streptomyces sp. ISL-90]